MRLDESQVPVGTGSEDVVSRLQIEGATRVAQIRVLTSMSFLVIAGYLGFAGAADWAAYVVPLSAYVGFALLILGVFRAEQYLLLHAYVGPVADCAAVLWLQTVSMPLSSYPAGVAGWSLGLLVFVILLSVLALRSRAVIVTSGAAFAAEAILQREANVGWGAIGASAVVLAASAAAGTWILVRLRSLAFDWLAAELRRREAVEQSRELQREKDRSLPGEPRLRPTPALPATPVVSDTLAPGSAGPAQDGFLAIGTSVGRYLIVDTLGTGGMSHVYAAYDPELDRRVALKLLRVGPWSPSSSEGGRMRLQREAQAMARLAHPNVVAVYDVGTYGDRVFLAMELVVGRTLQEWMDGGPRPWRDVVQVFLAAGRGLVAAHGAGLIHRDFKPSNVLVSDDGRVCVTDFGLARSAKERSEAGVVSAPAKTHPGDGPLNVSLTLAGDVLGTPGYMPPEQMSGMTVDATIDQFSFAVSLFQALYRGMPFTGATFDELCLKMMTGAVNPPPKDITVPPVIRTVLLRAMAADPRQRFPSMALMLEELTRLVAPRDSRWPALAAAVLAFVTFGFALYQARRVVSPAAESALQSDAGTFSQTAPTEAPR